MDTKRREVCKWNGEAFDLARDAVNIRYIHLTYCCLLAWKANQSGIPIVHPLWYEFNQ
jgi:alpha 1,3-glucosidase